MKILIIAKTYHPAGMARAIQMRRVTDALEEYGNYDVTLITESANAGIVINGKKEIINCKRTVFKLFNKEKIAGIQLNDIIFLRKDTFIAEGTKLAKRVIVEKQIQLVLTVSTPFDAHSIGLNIKKEFPSIKWVTFFSDMWPSNFLPKPYKGNLLSAKKKTRMMQEVVKNCDGIITPSKYTLDIISKNFNSSAKTVAIPHCMEKKPTLTEGTLKGFIVHSGLLSIERIAAPLVEAVKELAAENKDFIGLVHIGSYDPFFKKLIDNYKCKNIFLLGHMPEAMANSIQGLFETGMIIEAPMKESSPFMPSKVTDIVKLNRKLIVISPKKSFLTDYAANNEGVFSCSYDKVEIKRCISLAVSSSETITEKATSLFDPENIASHYDAFFKTIVK